jgi:hypothetical protein
MNRRFTLPLNLQLFAADTGAETGGAADTDSGNNTGTPEMPKDIMIPKSRFDEVNQNYKSVKEQLDQFVKAQKKSEDDAAKQRGEFEQLYNTAQQEAGTFKEVSEKTTARVQELEGILGVMLESKLADIPKELHDLIPDNLSPEQKLAWIDKASSKGIFGATKQPDIPVGGSTNPVNLLKQDISSLDPISMLVAGYSSKI